MTKQNKALLKDFKAFIDWSIKENKTIEYVFFNLTHDIMGLSNKKDKFFSPRLKGFTKKNK